MATVAEAYQRRPQDSVDVSARTMHVNLDTLTLLDTT
jgi:hypothetical protein